MGVSTSGQEKLCHCGLETTYLACCGLYILSGKVPQSAEQLMRSRYSAFVECDEPYLLATWHPQARPSRVRFDVKQRWLGLKIRSTSEGTSEHDVGSVEFVARFKVDGKGHRLHEVSRFEKIQGRWYYLEGQHL